ncbi:MAG: protein kinase [Lentisphaeria bacterium]|nr:protein kinase [Lentisphaeria bacterium]
MDSDRDPRPTRLGAYEIRGEIGRGGMAVVYQGIQPSLNRVVAIKVLPAPFASRPELVARFEREGTIIAQLSHPNVVQVIDRGREGDTLYIVTEYVDGGSLDTRLGGGALPLQDVLDWSVQLCDALDHAHGIGVVHRDLKPSNILIEIRTRRPKITDFGIAQLETSTAGFATLTTENTSIGTMNYMSPEQRLDSHRVDHRTDIFSFGVILYQMLTGKLPIGHFRMPSFLRADVPIGLDAVVRKCLEESPEDRYQCAADIRADLLRLMRSRGLRGAGGGGGDGLFLTPRRRLVLAAAGVAAVLVLGAVLLAPWRARRPERAEGSLPVAESQPAATGQPLTGSAAGAGGPPATAAEPTLASAAPAAAAGGAAAGGEAVLPPAPSPAPAAVVTPELPSAPAAAPTPVPEAPSPAPAATVVPAPGGAPEASAQPAAPAAPGAGPAAAIPPGPVAAAAAPVPVPAPTAAPPAAVVPEPPTAPEAVPATAPVTVASVRPVPSPATPPAAAESPPPAAKPPPRATPDPPEAELVRAQGLVRNGRPAEALPILTAMMTRDPRGALAVEAQFALAGVYRDMGDRARAIAEYEVFLRLYSDSERLPEAILNKVRTEWELANEGRDRGPAVLGSLVRAVKRATAGRRYPADLQQRLIHDLQQVIARCPGTPRGLEALRLTAEICAPPDLSNARLAAETLLEVSRQDPDAGPGVLFEAARIYDRELGEKARAIELYVKVQAWFRDSREAAEARERLRELGAGTRP